MTDRRTVLELVCHSLDRGASVEFEGIGTFEKDATGYKFVAQTQPRVFIAYVIEDLIQARRLCEDLRANGILPWLDQDQLLPGQNWPQAIQRAIEASDIFVACFSTKAISKTGQFQNELRYALAYARKMPLDSIFMIPVRLDACTIPARMTKQVQYVDVFPDWDRGIKRLARSIHRATRERRPIHLRLVSKR